MVFGDSLLCGKEALLCRLDLLFRKVCCLPGAQIRNSVTRLKSLVQPSDYYQILLFYVDANDVATKSCPAVR